jgi:hypothetical protein
MAIVKLSELNNSDILWVELNNGRYPNRYEREFMTKKDLIKRYRLLDDDDAYKVYTTIRVPIKINEDGLYKGIKGTIVTHLYSNCPMTNDMISSVFKEMAPEQKQNLMSSIHDILQQHCQLKKGDKIRVDK